MATGGSAKDLVIAMGGSIILGGTAGRGEVIWGGGGEGRGELD